MRNQEVTYWIWDMMLKRAFIQIMIHWINEMKNENFFVILMSLKRMDCCDIIIMDPSTAFGFLSV